MDPIRIMLADDHPAFTAGIRAEIEKEDDMEVVGEASNGVEALQLAREIEPDILLLDMEMPGLSGLEVAQQLHAEGTSMLVLPLSGFRDPEYVFGVLENGAAGYMTKDESLRDIVEAIRKVMKGGVHISSRVAVEIVDEQRRKTKAVAEIVKLNAYLKELGITPTLLRILKLVADGHNNQQIAEMVFRSEHTVRNQVDRLKELIGVRWRPALVAWAWKHGIVHLELEDEESPT